MTDDGLGAADRAERGRTHGRPASFYFARSQAQYCTDVGRSFRRLEGHEMPALPDDGPRTWTGGGQTESAFRPSGGHSVRLSEDAFSLKAGLDSIARSAPHVLKEIRDGGRTQIRGKFCAVVLG